MLTLATAAPVLIVLPVVLVWAAVSDFLTMTIPNRLSIILIAAFIVLAPALGLPLATIGWSFVAAAVVFAVCFALFSFNVMGGGDAKLLTASALWFGLSPSLAAFIVWVAYAGGGVTLLFMLLRLRADAVAAMGIPLPVSLTGSRKIPYGIAIAIGGLLAFWSSPVAMLALDAVKGSSILR